MTKTTKLEKARDTRAARQSVRAKVRKALAVEGSDLKAADRKHLDAVLASIDATLKSKAAKRATKATAKAAKADAKADVKKAA